MDLDDIKNRFTYHPPKEGQPAIYAAIRSAGREFAQLIDVAAPDSREKSTAITKLEEAVMWANAAVARNPAKEPSDTASFEHDGPCEDVDHPQGFAPGDE